MALARDGLSFFALVDSRNDSLAVGLVHQSNLYARSPVRYMQHSKGQAPLSMLG